MTAAARPAAPAATASLAKCGYYFEDISEVLVQVTVPLEAACEGAALPKKGALVCAFSELSFKLEVTIGETVHRLNVGELLFRIRPSESVAKVRTKSKAVVVELAKLEPGKTWRKLTAMA